MSELELAYLTLKNRYDTLLSATQAYLSAYQAANDPRVDMWSRKSSDLLFARRDALNALKRVVNEN